MKLGESKEKKHENRERERERETILGNWEREKKVVEKYREWKGDGIGRGKKKKRSRASREGRR